MKIRQTTIVTAADTSHFQPLQNLLWTISHFLPDAKVIVYDLGLTAAESGSMHSGSAPYVLKDWQLRKFDYSQYPSYFNLKTNSGFMGFRPVVMDDVAHEIGSGSLLWLDAGTQLRGFPSQLLSTPNVYSSCVTTTTIKEKLLSGSYTALGVTPDLLTQKINDPGVCSFNLDNPQALALLDKWKQVTLNPNCTAPTGANLRNHNPDAVWAVIYRQAANTNGWTLNYKKEKSLCVRCDTLSLKETQWRILPKPAKRYVLPIFTKRKS